MLDTGSPPQEGERTPRTVSPPPSAHHGARSSTPGLSFFDGSPFYLHHSSLPPRPRSASAAPDMTVGPEITPRAPPFDQYSHGHSSHSTAEGNPLAMETSTDPRGQDPRRGAKQTREPAFVPSLFDIGSTLKQQAYHKRRAHATLDRVHRSQVSRARIERLHWKARSVQRTLAECIRCEDKHGFSVLFNAFHDALLSCLKSRRAGMEPPPTLEETPEFRGCFLDHLSSRSRDTVVTFLVRIQSDGTYTADCLAALTQRELLSLLPDPAASKGVDTVLSTASGYGSRTSRPIGLLVDGQLDTLSSHSFGCPLEALVLGARAPSSTGSPLDAEATRMWSSVCARLLVERKPGSEKLVPAVLDIWSGQCKWRGKDRLEAWIVQALRQGSFLLEQPSKQSFRVRVSGRRDGNAEDEAKAERFYKDAVDSFLDLLASEDGPSVIPEGALRMCRAIYTALQGSVDHQRAFPLFAATRWLFSAFLANALMQPEAHDMMTDHYIPELARIRILREIASRSHKVAFDVAYSWKHNSALSAESAQRMQAVLARLHPPTVHPIDVPSDAMDSSCSLTLSSHDVLTLIDALHPQHRPASCSSEHGTLRSGLQSSSSSISGFSLFQPVSTESKHAHPTPTLSSHPTCTPQHPRATPDTTKSGTIPTLPSDDQAPARIDRNALREAYAEIQDFYISHKADDQAQWAVLLNGFASQRKVTVLERAKHVKAHGLPDAKHMFDNLERQQIMTSRRQAEIDAVERAIERVLRHLAKDPNQRHKLPRNAASNQQALLDSISSLFVDLVSEAEDASDFVTAHDWMQARNNLEVYEGEDANIPWLGDSLEQISSRAERSLARSLAAINDCEHSCGPHDLAASRSVGDLATVENAFDRLRSKMWYTADVRTSSAYDDVRSAAGALRVMGKAKRSEHARLAPPLRHWSSSKLSSTTPHLKTEAQILELLSAPTNYGGPNKLSDEQSRTTLQWLERNNIENFCKGEERLHKLCMALRKCMDQLFAGQPSENAVMWSSVLFSREKEAHEHAPNTTSKAQNPSLPMFGGACDRQFDAFRLGKELPRSIDTLSTTSQTLSGSSSRELLDTRSPTLTTKSSGTLWSQAVTEEAPSSATSVVSYQPPNTPAFASHSHVSVPDVTAKDSFAPLRRHALSLLLSDIASGMFDDGCETDRAFWHGLGGELNDRHMRNARTLTGSPVTIQEVERIPPGPRRSRFDYDKAFNALLQKFSRLPNPTSKLDVLFEIQKLLPHYMAEHHNKPPTTTEADHKTTLQLGQLKGRVSSASLDVHVDGFRRVFSNSQLRPAAIFRDFQYIAALAPSDVLENTPQGKAFWNAGIALSGIKREACDIMTETADSIIAYHTNNRGHGKSPSAQQQQRDSATFTTPSRTPSAEYISKYSMADAAHLLQITAKEGNAAAQRELATLYLTHPELMEHIIAPFARPKDVFKEELQSKWRKNQDPSRCDPATMCVAHHWMSLSSRCGDALAKEYLRQREEMERLP